MELKVLKAFRDKETGKVYQPNDVAEFSDERAKVILADRRKLAEKSKPARKETSEEPKAEATAKTTAKKRKK